MAPNPRNRRAVLSEAELRDLYVDQKLTIDQIATRFSLASTTISRRLTDLGVPARRRGPLPGRRCSIDDQPRQWTAELAYAVGLITTDGCLSKDGRHLTMTSKDIDLLETVRRCLGVTARITLSTNPRPIHRLQWGDLLFHRWLNEVGLMPAKSLKLGPLGVPDEWMRDFLRGCIDGDGSSRTPTATTRSRIPRTSTRAYVYTRVYLSLVSASPRFVEWLRETLRRVAGVSGEVSVRQLAGRNDIWRLRYAKREALRLLRWMYYAPDLPCLRRKRDIAEVFLEPRGRPARRGPGRPMVV
ncbi:MAG TPA: LAGLIDADG family homing endonuclease [Candidatus Acidoferrum sp.]|nr:LAGLIDADG family homing endonuclease [Candidatus Acidoferrum sp.]